MITQQRLTLWAAALALLVGTAAAQIKYVAVVETELDAQSGADTKLNRAEVRQITAELRSVAVKNLPRDKYNIMTSETVMSQGSARLEECAEENCVIALGAKIGAEYIVRGIVSKFGASLTLSVEMYETEDGNLVATSGLVRSENTAELLDKAAAVCAEMYKGFAAAHRGAAKVPPAAEYAATANVEGPAGGTVSRAPNTDADETANVGRNIAPEQLRVDKPRPQLTLRKKIFRGTAIGLDVLGVLAFTYGYIENGNVPKEIRNDNGPAATRAAARRDAAYIAGAAFLASGITIHIFF